jgi:hypothetical protein
MRITTCKAIQTRDESVKNGRKREICDENKKQFKSRILNELY